MFVICRYFGPKVGFRFFKNDVEAFYFHERKSFWVIEPAETNSFSSIKETQRYISDREDDLVDVVPVEI